jgi:hypothetical protein
MAFVSKQETKRIRTRLIVRFGEVTMDSGTSLSCLGMQLSYDVSAVTIKIVYFTKQIVVDMNLKEQSSPGKKYL